VAIAGYRLSSVPGYDQLMYTTTYQVDDPEISWSTVYDGPGVDSAIAIASQAGYICVTGHSYIEAGAGGDIVTRREKHIDQDVCGDLVTIDPEDPDPEILGGPDILDLCAFIDSVEHGHPINVSNPAKTDINGDGTLWSEADWRKLANYLFQGDSLCCTDVLCPPQLGSIYCDSCRCGR